jgi:enoyl-CoA hydratase
MTDAGVGATGVGEQGATAPLTIVRRHAAGVAKLSRAGKGNAVNAAMRKQFAGLFPALARDPIAYAAVVRSEVPGVFSAGVDLEELASLADSGLEQGWRALADAAHLYWLQECFSKPTVSLIDGMVTGSGSAAAFLGTHRVGGHNFTFACPEPAAGLVPSGGIAFALSRMPDGIGMYLALTGTHIGRADAYRLGLLTHCIDSGHYSDIEARLADADPVDEPLDAWHGDAGAGELEMLRSRIARCFGSGSLADMAARLAAEPPGTGDWAHRAASAMQLVPPMGLAATHALLTRAASLDLHGTLTLEYQLSCRLLVHARNRSTVVSADDLLRDGSEPPLALPTRSEMQARRV